MNKLTGWRHFVRIRTILRWRRKAVKRRCIRKTPLPVKSAGCLMVRRSGMRLLGADPESSTLHRFWIPGSREGARPGMTGRGAARACTFVCKRYPPIMTRLTVNGTIHDIDAAPDTALLYVLRNDLELNGPKYGCGLGECGTCTVLIDGVAARSCVIPIDGCAGRDIVTLEGLGSRERPDPVQAAFIAEQAAQCGYCLNGMIMSTKALLLRNAKPSEQEVLEALRYNLCRCGAHIEIMRAAMRAAGYVAEAQD
jgi:nicotinate dehydrogenase subunit A